MRTHVRLASFLPLVAARRVLVLAVARPSEGSGRRSATSSAPGTRSGSSRPSATAATRAKGSGGSASATACREASLPVGAILYLPAGAGGA